MPNASLTEDLTRLIADLAEPALRDRGLLVRPIPFFEHFDRFRSVEAKLALGFKRYLTPLSEAAALRTARSYAFADELTRDGLRNFCSALPEEGEEAQRTLWAAAVLLDQILDEEEEDSALLAPVRAWVGRQATYDGHTQGGRPHAASAALKTFVAMLEGFFADCHQRARSASEYAACHTDLIRILDAELLSLRLPLEAPPDDRVRRIVYDKSALLCWVGFRACLLGTQIEPAAMNAYRRLCDAVGEVLWIMDDLVDLEEDLDRGVWNRTLWRLYDRVGEARFQEATRSKQQLAQMVAAERLVEQAIHAIDQRIAFVASHPSVQDPATLRSMLSFWITSWLGIYA